MTSVFPDYPYSLDDEPTEDWTVEQTLQWWLLRAHDETDAAFGTIVRDLTKQLEQGKEEIWECHNQVKETMKSGGMVLQHHQEVLENVDPQKAGSASVTSTSKNHGNVSAAVGRGIIHVEILTGEHEGNTFDLEPRTKAPCWVGRSQGKKFRDRGISLVKDLEVSTTHGKFELIRSSKLCYTDTDSTNGTLVNGDYLVPNSPFELRNGTIIVLGQTKMRVTLS